MDFQVNYISPEIKLSCHEDQLFKTEILFDHHLLVWFISGETKVLQAEGSYVFRAGDIFLIPRNQAATVINYPKDGLPHKTVAMHLSVERLRSYYALHPPKQGGPLATKIQHFRDHPLLESCLASLIPYFDLQQDTFPETIAATKIQEAISILRVIDPDIDALLSNFEVPGKIDLVPFMEKHFLFNMPLDQFSYLSGRSLSTFNRDFKKHFHTSPQKWLTQKRLELAHHQLLEKKKRPSEVYLEVGFEDLSHFSFAFKKQFGYSPTELRT